MAVHEEVSVRLFIMTWGLFSVWACFTDAMPAHVRKAASFVGHGFGVIMAVVGLVGLFFKLIPINDSNFNIGYIKFNMSSLAFTFLNNTMLFQLRYVVSVFLHPNNLVVIQSPVISEKVTKVVSIYLF